MELRVVPANEASWADIETVFGSTGEAPRCWCQWYKIRDRDWTSVPRDERARRLRAQTRCGEPDADTTTGLVAYLGEEPVGWVAVEPRSASVRLRSMRVPWSGRDEDRDDDTVWAVTCFVVRADHRRQGISRTLAAEAADYARRRGARAVEGYPTEAPVRGDDVWGDLHVGTPSTFVTAGFTEVSHPTKRRSVMRVDFAADDGAADADVAR